ncbi:elongation factor G [Psychromarinibacter sp. C21-152]|uniref:Elongation factor G n=1 Tax=Psychromarinibacter sediminicola TaxID=3033385 RepID=A0AAE3T8G2_9RHOB|nr:elongation factor G [Psychromarinibacter sediminicola]MDF0601385.1 elongation factor G [Psychromarinibacter sediminicola]
MRCFTVLGPSQSGKTTLTQALGALDGRADQSSFSDRFTLTTFAYLGEPWGAFDIAGGTDNLGAAGHALAACDHAVVVVSPDPEQAPQAAPYLRLIEEAGVPATLFVNHMDGFEGRVRDTVAALQHYAAHLLVLRQVPIREGGEITGAVDLISERAWEYHEGKPSSLVEMPEAMKDREQEARTELLEHIADFNDDLLEQLIEDRVPAPENVFSMVAEMHKNNQIIPVFLGAAAHRNGLTRLMKDLRHETAGPEAVAARLGVAPHAVVGVYADNRKHVGKSVLLRDLGGGLAQGKSLGGDTLGALNGADGKPAAAVEPGGLGVAVKSDHLTPGCVYVGDQAVEVPGWAFGPPPVFRRVLTPVSERDDARLSAALTKIAAIDPGMTLGQDEDSGHLLVCLQGMMHLRRLKQMLTADFDIEVNDAVPAGSYRETISKSTDKHYRHRKQSGGAGQFADIQITVKPQPRGAGFVFDEVVKGGAVPRNYIPAVQAGCEEACRTGPLGFRVIDVGVTLTDGKAHSVDSSDFAFRTAGMMGMREALAESGPVLLQPIDQVDIHLPSVYTGALVGEISSLKGQVLGFDPHPTAKGWDVFRALIPSPAQDALAQSLGGLTHGTAWYESRFDHYEEIHGREAEKVRADRADAMA